MSSFGTKRKDFDWNRTQLAAESLTEKKVAVIGGTNGIGRAIAKELIAKGADVIVVGQTFRDKETPKLRFVKADLSSMKAALAVAKELPTGNLDLLIMTQGIFAGKQRKTNTDGIELDMAISHLSRFVILREIADKIGNSRTDKSTKVRVFVWGFPGGERKADLDDFNSERNYKWSVTHSNTVLGNEALVLDSVERFPNVNFFGMNPGIISSNIMSGVLGNNSFLLKFQQIIMGMLFQSAEEYARKIVPLLFSNELEEHSGTMFGRHGDPIYPNPFLTDKVALKSVIDASEKLLKKANL